MPWEGMREREAGDSVLVKTERLLFPDRFS